MKDILTSFLDPINIKWLGGLVLLTVPSFLHDLPASVGTLAGACSALGGVGLIAMSIWQKYHVTRRANSEEKRRSERHARELQIFADLRANKVSSEIAEFELKWLNKPDK